MANWLDKAIGRKDDSRNRVVPYEIDCGCGTRSSGVRGSRAKRVICAQCGEAHFVLPANPYPESDRQYFAKRGAGPVASVAVETVDDSAINDVSFGPLDQGEVVPSDGPSSRPASPISPPILPPLDAESSDVFPVFETAQPGDEDSDEVEDRNASDAGSGLNLDDSPGESPTVPPTVPPLSEVEISFEAASTT
jgi:hypothetical protein